MTQRALASERSLLHALERETLAPDTSEGWNDQQPTGASKIEKFDRIIELNGVRGTCRDLLGASMHGRLLQMSVLKYSLEPA